MIRRELYMSKIRLFIAKDIVKVLSGIRRCGKSAMLGLIKKEFAAILSGRGCMIQALPDRRALML